MYVFLSYVYKIRFFLAFFIIEISLSSIILLLNNIPYEEIIYAVCIMSFIALVAGIYGVFFFFKNYKKIKKI